jgi:hypothetical protein
VKTCSKCRQTKATNDFYPISTPGWPVVCLPAMYAGAGFRVGQGTPRAPSRDPAPPQRQTLGAAA